MIGWFTVGWWAARLHSHHGYLVMHRPETFGLTGMAVATVYFTLLAVWLGPTAWREWKLRADGFRKDIHR